MRYGYLEEVTEETRPDGTKYKVATYSDQDGGEAGHVELELDETPEEEYRFDSGWDWDDRLDR